MTAGMADNLMPSRIITASSWMSVAMALNTINSAAHTDNSSTPTRNIAATLAHIRINANDTRRFMYCSQNMNGMPDG